MIDFITHTIRSFFRKRLVCIFVLMLGLMWGCDKEIRNPNIPEIFLNVTLDPNSTIYQPLNTVGGWMYLTSEVPSRGIIVHRVTIDEFVAFDRIPPNEPDRCCQGTVCTRLLVDGYYPFAKDTCTQTMYSLLDGSIFEGEGRYPMIRYNTLYSGGLLRIFN
ncbi:MAG: hypothetical protein M0Q41_03430 [Bacteroidales bacterium]|nr:hypothetical protein [Bacteroidales bacterium]